MEEIARSIFLAFAERTRFYSGRTALAEAQQQLNDQPKLYQQLFGLAREIKYQDDRGVEQGFGETELIDTMARWSANVLQRHQPSIADHPDGTKELRSPIPILDEESIAALSAIVGNQKEERHSSFARSLVTIAPLMERRQGIPQLVFDETAARSRTDLIHAIADYTAAKNLDQFQPTLHGRLDEEIAQQRFRIQRIEATSKSQSERQRTNSATFDALVTDLNEKIAAEQERMATLHESLSNFEAAIRQELQLDRARETWSKRYKEAQTSFHNTVILLAVMVALPFMGAFWFGPAVVRFVNNFDLAVLLGAGGSGAVFGHFLTRLVIISVPLFAYLWGLRVVIRYFTRSMTLKDDARMRETMLDTYFTLIEAGRADEASRPIILNALFRPAPGHGTEGTEPPEMAAYLETIAKMGRA